MNPRRYPLILAALGLVLCFTPTLVTADSHNLLEHFWHQYYGDTQLPHAAHYSTELVAKARPDECFYGLGDPRNLASFSANYPNDLSPADIEACIASGGMPKVNQAYVWGLARSGDKVWFGTVANLLCQVIEAMGFAGGPIALGPHVTSSWVCELQGMDARPPRIFVYDIETGELRDKTELVLARVPDRDLLLATTGLRSAGALGRVVFLGGLTQTPGPCSGGVCTTVTLFAFDSKTEEYLGARNYPEYNNIRQWRVVNGELYTGMGQPAPGFFGGAGEILRWTGRRSTDPAELFQFKTVGRIQGDPAYLAEHDGRLFVSTWGGPPDSGGATLYMSPRFGRDHKLSSADADRWEVVWQISAYEVEPSAFYFGGALASHDGHLYWGTMSVPGIGLGIFSQLYGLPADTRAYAAAFLGTYRPTVLFRGKDFGDRDGARIELLYGTAHLPRYNPATQAWEIVPNRMGEAPRFGLAGINNFFNNYTWWMEPYRGELFVGTMDFLYVAGGFAEVFGITIPESIKELAHHFTGADLYVFNSDSRPARPVSISGLGNYTNYGFRTMVVADDSLYIGTANAMNLLTDPTDDRPEGGWELIRLDVDHRCHQKHHDYHCRHDRR
jgi:hypothetical protein